jgi:hypothetical protein
MGNHAPRSVGVHGDGQTLSGNGTGIVALAAVLRTTIWVSFAVAVIAACVAFAAPIVFGGGRANKETCTLNTY